MSSPLNKSHPFRPSITHDGGSEALVAQVRPQDACSLLDQKSEVDQVSEEKSSVVEKVKKTAKILKWVFLGSILVFGYFSIYSLLHPDENVAQEEPGLIDSLIGSDAPPVDPEYKEMEGRTVEDARRSAGIFARVFCRGAKRSAFCD